MRTRGLLTRSLHPACDRDRDARLNCNMRAAVLTALVVGTCCLGPAADQTNGNGNENITPDTGGNDMLELVVELAQSGHATAAMQLLDTADVDGVPEQAVVAVRGFVKDVLDRTVKPCSAPDHKINFETGESCPTAVDDIAIGALEGNANANVDADANEGQILTTLDPHVDADANEGETFSHVRDPVGELMHQVQQDCFSEFGLVLEPGLTTKCKQHTLAAHIKAVEALALTVEGARARADIDTDGAAQAIGSSGTGGNYRGWSTSLLAVLGMFDAMFDVHTSVTTDGEAIAKAAKAKAKANVEAKTTGPADAGFEGSFEGVSFADVLSSATENTEMAGQHAARSQHVDVCRPRSR